MKISKELEEKLNKYTFDVSTLPVTNVDTNGALHLISTPIIESLFKTDKRIVILQGGGDSGKTSGTLTYLAARCVETPGTSVLITGQDLTNLKLGALDTFNKYIRPCFSYWIKSYNISYLTFYFHNGSKIKFDSFANEQDARGSERDYLYMNECNGQTYQLFWQLNRKTRKQAILDYNPSGRFWVHDKLFKDSSNFERQFEGSVVRYISNHWHNPYLTREDHIFYETISDPELKRVYCDGLTGKVKGIIYPNVKSINDFPNDCEEIFWGLDYGYTNDPTAIVKIGRKGMERYIKECYYEPQDEAMVIKEIMIENGWDGSHNVYAEHDNRINTQLALSGMNIIKAYKKNKISGISKVRTFNLYYTKDSLNFKREIETYKWSSVTNINTGEEVTTNVPVDGTDHLLDAMLYGINTNAIQYQL